MADIGKTLANIRPQWSTKMGLTERDHPLLPGLPFQPGGEENKTLNSNWKLVLAR